MKIEGNQKELDAMKEFHKGNRQSLRRPFEKNTRTKIIALAKKLVDITETAKNA